MAVRLHRFVRWLGFPLLKHCDHGFCDQIPGGVDVREEEENPTVAEDLRILVLEALGLPTIILVIASGAYFSGKFLYRRINSN